MTHASAVISSEIGSLHIGVYANKTLLGGAAAAFVAEQISAAIRVQGNARVIFATGASQHEFLHALTRIETVDWTRVTAFHLDEYVDLPEAHPASFRAYLQERLFSRLSFAEVHLLNGQADDITAECKRYSRLLQAAPIDIACIGIGENAHLAFNDPPAAFDTEAWVHVVELDEKCRQQQVNEGQFLELSDVPPRALSVTIPAILKARTLSVVVPDQRKAAAVRCALQGSVDPMCPASALQQHANCHIFLDQPSASLLNLQG